MTETTTQPIPSEHGITLQMRKDDFPLPELMKAVRQCAKGVSWKNSVLRWILPQNLLRFCLDLKKQLDSGTYKLGGYAVFTIYEPKKREIQAPKFRDRVVQRCMCNNGVYDDLTRGNVYDNGACQTGKGTSFALGRMKCFLLCHFRKHGRHGWCLCIDIHHFFNSIPHDKLKKMVWKLVLNKRYAMMICDVIDSYDDPGLGLGSQLSQLLAIAFLSPILDHIIKEKFHIRFYIRYSDDIRIIHEDKEVLKKIWKFIAEELGKNDLELNPKSCIYPISHGVMFMKWRFILTGRGRVLMIKKRSHVRRFVRYMNKRRKDGCTEEDYRNSFESWRSHMEMGNSHNTINKIRKKLNVKRNQQ